MEQTNLLSEGVVLMVVGMLIVYSFLIVLIGAVSFSRFFERFAYLLPDAVPARPAQAPTADRDEEVRIAVAIATANRR